MKNILGEQGIIMEDATGKLVAILTPEDTEGTWCIAVIENSSFSINVIIPPIQATDIALEGKAGELAVKRYVLFSKEDTEQNVLEKLTA